MKTFKYILALIPIVLFLGCAGGIKSAYFNQEADRKYEEEKYSQALDLYNKAAENGSGYAYYRLYEIYKYGKNGVRKDIPLSTTMIKKAVELGDYRAEYIYSLRFLYSSTPNYPKAIKLLESAAKKEYPYAYQELGHVYLYALGVTQDKQRAVEYYRLANSFGLRTPDVNKVKFKKYKVKTISQKELIKKVQTNLKKLGFYKSRVDGITGPMTRKSVSSFQKFYGYNVTGRVSKEVLEQTNKELAK